MKIDTSKYFVIKESKLKTSELLQKCRDKFPVYSWYSDEQLDKDFPPPKKITTRYFKKTVDADKNLKNKSANDLEREGIKCITLREKLIMDLQHFKETGKHLDIRGWTLCAGSRDSGGFVPCSGWDDGRARLSWCCANDRYENLCGREAVSINSSPLIPKQCPDTEYNNLETRIKALEERMNKYYLK